MAGSLSRSLVQEASGCKTQLTSVISALLLLSVLLFLGPYFQPLPVCVLAAIILASLIGMIKKVADIHKFWSRSTDDGLLWAVTFLATVFLDVDLGLIAGVVMNLGIILVKANIPTVVVLQQENETKEWLDRARYKMTREGNDLPLVVRVKGPLNFLTIGLVKTLIEFEIMSGMHQNRNKVLSKRTSDSIIKIETGDLDELSTSEDEIILFILDLSYVTCVDSKGCSLLPWV